MSISNYYLSGLRSPRACRGFQEYMAKQLSISQKTYIRWENEADSLSLSDLESICSVLGVDVYRLIGNSPHLVAEVTSLRKEVIILQNTVNQIFTLPLTSHKKQKPL